MGPKARTCAQRRAHILFIEFVMHAMHKEGEDVGVAASRSPPAPVGSRRGAGSPRGGTGPPFLMPSPYEWRGWSPLTSALGRLLYGRA